MLPVLELLEQYMTPALDTALLCRSRAGYILQFQQTYVVGPVQYHA